MRFKEFEEKYINIIAKSFSAAGIKQQYTSDEAIEIIKASFVVIAKEFNIPEENMELAIKNLENRKKGLSHAAKKGVEDIILISLIVILEDTGVVSKLFKYRVALGAIFNRGIKIKHLMKIQA